MRHNIGYESFSRDRSKAISAGKVNISWLSKPNIAATGVIVAGLINVAYVCLQPYQTHRLEFIAIMFLCFLSAALKVRIPDTEGTMSLNFVFVLLGVIELNPIENILTGVIGMTVQSLWRVSKNPHWIQFVFNLANISLSVSCARWTFAHFPLFHAFYAHFFGDALVFFLVNTYLVALVVARNGRHSVFCTWREWHLLTFPYYGFGAFLAFSIDWTYRHYGWELPAFAFLAILLCQIYYRRYIDKVTVVRRVLNGFRNRRPETKKPLVIREH